MNFVTESKKRKAAGTLLCCAVLIFCAAAAMVPAATSDTYWLPLTGAGHGGWALDKTLTGADNFRTPPSGYTRIAFDASAANPATLGVEAGADGKGELVVRTARSKPIGIVRAINEDSNAWGKGRAFVASFLTPDDPDLHASAQLIVYHNLYGWFASEPTRPLAPGQWTTVYWHLGDDGTDWMSMSYGLAWHNNMRYELDRVGLRIFCSAATEDKTGAPASSDDDNGDPKDKDDAIKEKDAANAKVVEMRIAGIGIEGVDDALPPLKVLDLRWPGDGAAHGSAAFTPVGADAPSTVSCRVGQRFELSFELTRSYDNPYDPDCVAADVEFLAPSGKVVSMPAFYDQEFERRKLEDGTETYDPIGRACWKARFRAAEPGLHTFSISVKDRSGAAYRTPSNSFAVAPGFFRGFLRVDPNDPQFLSFTNGEFFYPIGIILRSPDDDRMLYKYDFELIPGKGLAVYDDYFTSMGKAGVNFVRVWMGAWWTALEWTHGYRNDYAGLGRYSQLNAWRMDHVVDQAERCGVYIDLTLHNHGQFRASDFDSEWYDNPYFRGFGGPVDQPEEFWTNEDARKWLRKKLRYMIARWSSSPAIGWWELCNEVDLVGNYDSSRITSWHRDMGRSLKEIDPYDHIVAAHYTGSRLDPSVQALPENEVAQQTAYNADMPARLVEMYNNHHVFNKPVYVNEFGVGGSYNELLYNLHSGLWASAVIPFCGSALFWWWPWVHEMNEYGQYTSVAHFLRGEDLRGKGYQLSSVVPAERSRIIETRAMQSQESARIWIYDQRIYRSISDTRRMRAPVVRPCPASVIIVDSMKAGDYKIEFWDTWKGEVSATRTVHHSGGPMNLATPAFERDIACKIDRLKVK